MNKDSQAKLGRTKCDFCDTPAVAADGQYVVCARHATANAADGVKRSSARDVPLKSAGLVTENLHNEG